MSTFAQELRTAEPVSPKRLAKLVEGLRCVVGVTTPQTAIRDERER